MPVVSIEPSDLAPFVVSGLSMPVCGAGPVFWAKAEPHRSARAVTVISFFIDVSFGDLQIIRRAKCGSWIGGGGAKERHGRVIGERKRRRPSGGDARP